MLFRSFYLYEKAQLGAGATFLGGEIKKIENKKILKAWALGDTNLFVIRQNNNLISFPIRESKYFSTKTDQFVSIPHDIASLNKIISYYGEIKSLELEILEDDIIICSTDSISAWYLQNLESNHLLKYNPMRLLVETPWNQLLKITNLEEFKEFIKKKINTEKMKNDDSTIFVLRIK